jgi:hypothetical protein
MGFLTPKVSRPPLAPNPATPAMDPLGSEGLTEDVGTYSSARSLINTSSRGLKRRASVQRTSLIGG